VTVGTVESNSHTAEASCLTISCHTYNKKGPIYYPPFDKVCVGCQLFLVFMTYLAKVLKLQFVST